MNIYIYEDQTTLDLEPIVLTRPSFDLRCGAFTFLERVQSLLPDARFSLIVREELAGLTQNRFPDLTVNPSEVQSGFWLKGAVLAMKKAIQDAGLSPANIDYINAHGTSTPLNDKNETNAIKEVFGDHAYSLKISSTKSMTGHLLGASGSIEAIASVKAMEHNLAPPTINYVTADSDCDLDYVPNTVQNFPIDTVMSNSFGFGGHNAVILIKRWEG